MQKKQLPIGIQTFREIREGNFYYIDKTKMAVDLVNSVKHCFLSRPRRFGKSLFLDTLKELFEGNEKLFKGLAAEKQWDWSVQYPVIRFSFAGSTYAEKGMAEQDISEQLNQFAREHGVSFNGQNTSGRFRELIEHVEQQIGQRVVVLVDEYDKPILDAISDPEVARHNRDFLRGFYSVIKDYDAHIKFSFLTGVSKFSKVSIFSGLNNLYDLTLVPHYATICGYTDYDIDTVFMPELPGLDRQEIRDWYNGYNWLGEGVYNPFDSEQVTQQIRLYELLMQNDFDGLKQLFHAFFASIPHHWYTNSQIQRYEGYYASVFYSYFASLGLNVTVEDITNLGRIDMTLKFNEQVYIFEFKVVEMVPEGNALQQIKDKCYADKYRSLAQPIHLIGVEFSRDSRNITGFEVERG